MMGERDGGDGGEMSTLDHHPGSAHKWNDVYQVMSEKMKAVFEESKIMENPVTSCLVAALIRCVLRWSSDVQSVSMHYVMHKLVPMAPLAFAPFGTELLQGLRKTYTGATESTVRQSARVALKSLVHALSEVDSSDGNAATLTEAVMLAGFGRALTLGQQTHAHDSAPSKGLLAVVCAVVNRLDACKPEDPEHDKTSGYVCACCPPHSQNLRRITDNNPC